MMIGQNQVRPDQNAGARAGAPSFSMAQTALDRRGDALYVFRAGGRVALSAVDDARNGVAAILTRATARRSKIIMAGALASARPAVAPRGRLK